MMYFELIKLVIRVNIIFVSTVNMYNIDTPYNRYVLFRQMDGIKK